MATSQPFFVEDSCALKSDPTRIGEIDRTFSDVSTHRPDPLHAYPSGIRRGKSVSKTAYQEFLRSGIPPRGVVLVTWIRLPWELEVKSMLIRERELKLVSRCVMTGDVVKGRAQDAMSGTIISTTTSVDLIQPLRWPQATSQPEIIDKKQFGNYSKDVRDVLRGVSTEELMPPHHVESEQFIIYKGWVGRIADTYEDVHVRLGNGSIVVVDDPDSLELYGADVLTEVPVVGDFVTTKKANLRRGRWIYGEFSANIDPCGYVAGIHTTSLEIDWLCSKYPVEHSPLIIPVHPPYELDIEVLDNGEAFLYDRRAPSKSGVKRNDFEVSIGRGVKFRDIAGAALKHDGKTTLPDGSQQSTKLTRVLRTDSLGYDINVFLVAQAESMATVLWQDSTRSEVPANDLIPYLDLGGEDEAWPGELIGTRVNMCTNNDTYIPEKVGIVQSVNATDRMARVKWFPEAKLMFTTGEEPILIPGSYTGEISNDVDEISLYEIWTLPGLTRRLGDYIVVQPVLREGLRESPTYADAYTALYSPSEDRAWFGEVIELGLDGKIVVRLGAAVDVHDVRLPWECTLLVHSSDLEEMEDDDMDLDTEDETDESGSDHSSVVSEIVEIQDDQGVWRPAGPESEDVEDWTTDEDDDILKYPPETWEDVQAQFQARLTASKASGASSGEDDEMHDALEGPLPSTDIVDEETGNTSDECTFSYLAMFEKEGPEPFALLDGEAPADHHFASRIPQMDNLQLRRIQKEHKILRSSLPDGVYVRSWDSALDLLRVLILGPLDTPYEYAPFIIDLHLDANFPAQPPQAFFHSWTASTGPINPNLYEDGKICLSLLGTWHGDGRNETWSTKSTILQLLVSLLGLVLVKEPFYNEAGYEVRAGTAESRVPSAMYSERTYFKSLAFITYALAHPVTGFEKELQQLYGKGGPELLRRATMEALQVMRRSKNRQVEVGNGNGRSVSLGALVPLRRQVEALIKVLQKIDENAAEDAQALLDGL